MRPFACFVLSTGRCGTQSLASFLGASESATVTHEPIGLRYLIPDAVREHAASIESGLATKSYIECGHPCWRALPDLIERFEGRVRIIHLVRDPVRVAFSWVTHRAFCRPISPHVPERVLLTPFDHGVRYPEYRQQWPSLPPHEKVLYYWLEVNSFPRPAGVPWLTMRFEDFVTGAATESLAAFLGIDALPALPPNVDKHHSISEFDWDPNRVRNHPLVVRLAETFGYDLRSLDAAAYSRYGLPP